MGLTKNYWKNRYQNQETGWDIGYASTPITQYFNTIEDKSIRILIPGAGNAHEAEYLYKQGFTNVYICDWAEEPLQNFAERVPSFPKEQLICTDFFTIDLAPFDIIVEQTFFCALPPTMRWQYITKMYQLLKPTGELIGLMFKFPLSSFGPPFGGSLTEYKQYFKPFFDNISIKESTDSIKPRKGSEYWIELSKKKQIELIQKEYVEVQIFEGIVLTNKMYKESNIKERYAIFATFFEGTPTFDTYKKNPNYFDGRVRSKGVLNVSKTLKYSDATVYLSSKNEAEKVLALYGQGRQLPMVEDITHLTFYQNCTKAIVNELR